MIRRIASFAGCLMLAAVAFAADSEMPRVEEVGTVASNIATVKISTQDVIKGRQIPYQAQPGDEVDNGTHRAVRRDGKAIGWLAGAEGKVLFTVDEVTGDPLDVEWAMQPDTYRITSSDDSRFANGVAPQKVHRKTWTAELANTAQGSQAVLEHMLYLVLPQDLESGKQYTIEFNGEQIQGNSAEFVFDPTKLTSPAVHVSQIGFRPDDPAKVAFLSCWMGDGGGLSYEDGLSFKLIDDQSGQAVYEGKTRLSKRAEEVEGDKNYQQADVHEMVFSEFSVPGTYRVSVEGVGCSLPFPIAEDAWTKAFYVSIRGLFHQRSGIALGPPHTDFNRPRGFHPDDGVKIYHSSHAVGEANSGGNNFQKLVAGRTEEIVPDAWGGYMDAADWDRRPIHIDVPRLLLDLYAMAPEKMDSIKLNIPESENELPDVLDEALWLIDFHLRTQTPEGGIRPGIESAEHPRMGEGSWQESLMIMAYAPGPRMSYKYAGAAARAAHVLGEIDPSRSELYGQSALKAFEWADAQKDDSGPTANDRLLAAVELFRLTGEAKWQEIFLKNTKFSNSGAEYNGTKVRAVNYDAQDEAGWVYLQTDRPEMDSSVKENVRRALLASADADIESMSSTAFGWIPSPFRFKSWGTTSNPDAVTLVRAHYLTKDERYLSAAVLACQYAAGANPLNLVYTTGVGVNSVKQPIHCDARVTNQMPPPGLTVFGAISPDWKLPERHQGRFDMLLETLYPNSSQWPPMETYFDIGTFPPMTEFTVVTTMAPTAYVWGYLGAR